MILTSLLVEVLQVLTILVNTIVVNNIIAPLTILLVVKAPKSTLMLSSTALALEL
jgi:hypothetical protein